ncbi:MAG TPA: 3D-(3,5/4)-trihydroxycyclohexane-1,2-dione acylhydrolase (decyclizing) [Gemmatimonadales bacterium]|nr:3D-(3,5/4)-trihydroxycyclohexane-1,2-dione acylhydrolase (decyclizing) [Gemmatimonadales bacterium]
MSPTRRTERLTLAQALVRFLAVQRTERDGVERPFIAGVFGIFGHGNVAGIGQALQQPPEQLRYYQSRNEQAQVHVAAAYARMTNRLQTLACTSSVGPGATNMITGAAGATINRLPVLLLPGDVFATRRVGSVLQQLESGSTEDVSVNDAFRPISRYWDRLTRPEQLIASAPEAMRVLTSPADTGAVTLALPQDVQAEAYEYPAELFEPRVWHIPRPLPDEAALRRAVELIRASRRPLIIAGGGVIYSEASAELAALVEATGIPVGETQAGKGALRYDHPSSLGAIGVTGTPGANRLAREADLVIGIGTRYSDFTTASRTAFQDSSVRFINLNVTEFDAYKQAAMPLVGDARATLRRLAAALDGWSVAPAYREAAARCNAEWDREVERIYGAAHEPLPSQGEVIGAVNRAAGPRDVVVCAAGSLPGDLHKLWRARDPKSYHVEYGYSCMGYEVAGGLGVKLAAPDREVYVMVGDGSWLMMSSELVTAVQEGIKLTVVLVDNHGFASIGGLSAALGSQGFGTEYRYRSAAGQLDGAHLPVDLAANAESLGACVRRVRGLAELERALDDGRRMDRTSVIHVETDPQARVGSYESWWDVPVAEVSTMESVRAARAAYDASRARERWHL